MYIELLCEVSGLRAELVGSLYDMEDFEHLAIVRINEGHALEAHHPSKVTILEKPQDEIALELVTLLVQYGAKYRPQA